MKFLAVGFVLSACATPTYTTKHGVKVFNYSDVNIPQVDIEQVINVAAGKIPLNTNSLEDVEVHFYSKLIQIGTDEDPEKIVADGYRIPFSKIVLISIFSQCLPRTAMLHELTHLMYGDRNHEDKKLWDRVKNTESVLNLTLCTKEQIELEDQKRAVPDYKISSLTNRRMSWNSSR